MRLRVVKTSHSHHPWRIVTDDGRQLLAPLTFDIDGIGQHSVSMPMSYPTRQAATEALGDLAGALLAHVLGDHTEGTTTP